MSSPIRLATAALSRRVYAGRPTKDGMGLKEPRYDVTSDVLKACVEHIGVNREATVNIDGQPAYTITVRSITTTEVATPPAEPDWITHDGGPNPAPGKMVDWRNREGREETCESDELAGWGHPHEAGERYDIIAYRVTEGVKP